MADDLQAPEIDEELELAGEATPPDQDHEEGPDDEGGEEEVPTFGDSVEEEQDTDNATIRHLRQTLKATQKELSEARKSVPQPQAVEVGEKPTLAACDYDEEKFESELDAWKERKAAVDRQQNASTQAAEEQRKAWESRLTKVTGEKAALGRSDADTAFDTVAAALGEAKFAGVLQLLDDGTNGAAFIYALSKNPDQLTALASQNDAVRLVKDVTRLEGQLKMVKRKAPPAIDAPERGSGAVAQKPNAARKQLEKMEADYEKRGGGDRTEIITFKKQNGLT